MLSMAEKYAIICLRFINLLRVLLCPVLGLHPSDVPPKSKISVQIEQNGNGRRSGAFLHISFKNSSICKAFGVRQRPPQGAEFVCVPCGANNSKSGGGDTVPVRPRSPAPIPRSFERGIFLCGTNFPQPDCAETFFALKVSSREHRTTRVGILTKLPPSLL